MHVKRNPAVFAGLMGTATLMAPQTAHALSLQGVADVVASDPGAAFALGAVSGALVAGAACAGVCALRARSRRHEEEIAAGFAPAEKTGSFDADLDDDGQASEHAPRHMRRPVPAKQPAPTKPAASADEPPAAQAASHATDDYGQIAENYVRRITFRDRMARRAEGVAAALTSRFGEDMMDGLPVIPFGRLTDDFGISDIVIKTEKMF